MTETMPNTPPEQEQRHCELIDALDVRRLPGDARVYLEWAHVDLKRAIEQSSKVKR